MFLLQNIVCLPYQCYYYYYYFWCENISLQYDNSWLNFSTSTWIHRIYLKMPKLIDTQVEHRNECVPKYYFSIIVGFGFGAIPYITPTHINFYYFHFLTFLTSFFNYFFNSIVEIENLFLKFSISIRYCYCIRCNSWYLNPYLLFGTWHLQSFIKLGT